MSLTSYSSSFLFSLLTFQFLLLSFSCLLNVVFIFQLFVSIVLQFGIFASFSGCCCKSCSCTYCIVMVIVFVVVVLVLVAVLVLVFLTVLMDMFNWLMWLLILGVSFASISGQYFSFLAFALSLSWSSSFLTASSVPLFSLLAVGRHSWLCVLVSGAMWLTTGGHFKQIQSWSGVWKKEVWQQNAHGKLKRTTNWGPRIVPCHRTR